LRIYRVEPGNFIIRFSVPSASGRRLNLSGDLTVSIEQAIFTSADTGRAQGYQLVCHSDGLSEADARELAVWGPSHDSLLERPGELSSTNFFRLQSGAYCVSRTVPAGAEYSGRGGEVVYTHFLIVPSEALARFSNNPFAVLRAARAIGALEPREHLPESLEALTLSGRTSPVEMPLVANLARDPGPAALATLIQAALASDRLAVASPTPNEQLIAGLVNLLPVECRTEFSFSTGLKCSTGRPVRIACLPEEPSSWRATARCGVTLLDLNNAQVSDEVSWKGWAGCVARILSAGKLSLLAAELEQPRPWLTCANLPLLSKQVEADLHRGSREFVAVKMALKEQAASDEPSGSFPSGQQRTDAPHFRGEKSASAATAGPLQRAAEQLADALAGQPAEVLELLERVDDLVFAAISGDNCALAELEVLWPTVSSELDASLVEQSREQYLRCALSICSDSVQGEMRRPQRAAAAIDVLCVLFDA
jgi:hypothetical protein